jgi:protein SCO1/2
MNKTNYIKKTVMLIVIITASVAGIMTSNHYFNKTSVVNYKSLLIYPEPKTFTGFKLINKKNETITIEEFSNKWTLLFFGFTSCPDVCPTTLTELQRIYKSLEQKIPDNLPQVLFVSVDPDRDTPEVLKNYIDFFNPSFSAATADNANLISLTSQIGVAYIVEEHTGTDTYYNVDHTAVIFVISPEKQLFGIFPTPHNESDITADLLQLIGH